MGVAGEEGGTAARDGRCEECAGAELARLAGGKPGRLGRVLVGSYCWVRVTDVVALPPLGMIWKVTERGAPVGLGRMFSRRSPLATPSVGSRSAAMAGVPDSETL